MYKITKSNHIITDMHDPVWDKAQTAEVICENWKIEGCYKPPYTTAKLMYSELGLHVKMTTNEKNLRAVEAKQNGPICEDSCMEFFIRPNENDPRYINFEINPTAVPYISVRYDRYKYEFLPDKAEAFGIVSEVTPTLWTLFYTIPFEVIDRIFGSHTNKMYGNFYKCGDKTERMHYASYYPIHDERADFHLPETFGEFELE